MINSNLDRISDRVRGMASFPFQKRTFFLPRNYRSFNLKFKNDSFALYR